MLHRQESRRNTLLSMQPTGERVARPYARFCVEEAEAVSGYPKRVPQGKGLTRSIEPRKHGGVPRLYTARGGLGFLRKVVSRTTICASPLAAIWAISHTLQTLP